MNFIIEKKQWNILKARVSHARFHVLMKGKDWVYFPDIIEPVVVVSKFIHLEFGRNDQRKDAPNFSIPNNIGRTLFQTRLGNSKKRVMSLFS